MTFFQWQFWTSTCLKTRSWSHDQEHFSIHLTLSVLFPSNESLKSFKSCFSVVISYSFLFDITIDEILKKSQKTNIKLKLFTVPLSTPATWCFQMHFQHLNFFLSQKVAFSSVVKSQLHSIVASFISIFLGLFLSFTWHFYFIFCFKYSCCHQFWNMGQP